MTITQWAKDGVLRLARVPAEPHVPEGAEESVRVFNAGRNYFAWRLILWGIANTAIALGLLVSVPIQLHSHAAAPCAHDLVGFGGRRGRRVRGFDPDYVLPAAAELRDAVVHRHRPKLAYSQRCDLASGDDDDVCQRSGNSSKCESH